MGAIKCKYCTFINFANVEVCKNCKLPLDRNYVKPVARKEEPANDVAEEDKSLFASLKKIAGGLLAVAILGFLLLTIMQLADGSFLGLMLMLLAIVLIITANYKVLSILYPENQTIAIASLFVPFIGLYPASGGRAQIKQAYTACALSFGALFLGYFMMGSPVQTAKTQPPANSNTKPAQQRPATANANKANPQKPVQPS